MRSYSIYANYRELCQMLKHDRNPADGCHLLLESPAGIHISSSAFARCAKNSPRNPDHALAGGRGGYRVAPRWRGVAGDARREDAGARVCATSASRATTSQMEKGKASPAVAACGRPWASWGAGRRARRRTGPCAADPPPRGRQRPAPRYAAPPADPLPPGPVRSGGRSARSPRARDRRQRARPAPAAALPGAAHPPPGSGAERARTERGPPGRRSRRPGAAPGCPVPRQPRERCRRPPRRRPLPARIGDR
jgi:hypothetical protein